jgi:hypothetical protein
VPLIVGSVRPHVTIVVKIYVIRRKMLARKSAIILAPLLFLFVPAGREMSAPVRIAGTPARIVCMVLPATGAIHKPMPTAVVNRLVRFPVLALRFLFALMALGRLAPAVTVRPKTKFVRMGDAWNLLQVRLPGVVKVAGFAPTPHLLHLLKTRTGAELSEVGEKLAAAKVSAGQRL